MDIQTFQQTFLSLQPKLYRFALRYVRDPMAAEDIVQDVFVRIWQKGEALLQIENPEAYCMTMTRNLSLNYLKAKNQQNLGMDAAGQPASKGPLADRQMELNEQMTVLREAITQLTERQQLVLHLREVEDMTYDQIATTVEISLAMVKSELYRARQALKRKMEQYVRRS